MDSFICQRARTHLHNAQGQSCRVPRNDFLRGQAYPTRSDSLYNGFRQVARTDLPLRKWIEDDYRDLIFYRSTYQQSG